MDLDLTGGFLLVADQARVIRIAPLDTLEYRTIQLERAIGVPVAIDYDPEDQMFYWTDILEKTISRAFLDGSGQEVVLNLGNVSGKYHHSRHNNQQK